MWGGGVARNGLVVKVLADLKNKYNRIFDKKSNSNTLHGYKLHGLYSNDSKIYSLAHLWERVRVRVVPAFTLTEVLLAVLIVGVIAAMVLPAVVTKYQDKTFESAFKREVHSLQDSIDSLAALENKPSFYETSLAKTPETYMKKYLRVSKYCGTSGKDCFGKFYSEYSNHEKKTYTPSYDGNCAILKNGTSVCLNVNGGSIDMLIDVNGPKGPNVLGRDLRTYTHTVRGKDGYDMSSSGIIALNQTPIKEDNSESDPDPTPTPTPDPDPTPTPKCTASDTSLTCCKERTIKDESDACCQWSYYDNDKTCHPCSVAGAVKFSGIGCVYTIPFNAYSPVTTGSSEMQMYDPNWTSYSKNHYDQGDYNLITENYWAGAKRACALKGMNMTNLSEIKSIYHENQKYSRLKNISTYFWVGEDNGDTAAYTFNLNTGRSGFDGKGHYGYGAVCLED